jgi:phosphatidylserine/phosphatidylglycerophosphate/cardiolipin synthase-like enzyme
VVAVGIGLAWLSKEWDGRVAKGFPLGQKPWVVLSPPATAPAPDEEQARTAGATAAATPRVSVYFSPNGGATEAVVGELGLAKLRVRVQAYSFTSAPTAKAVVDAKRRGINVVVILDSTQGSPSPNTPTFWLKL